MPGRPAPCRSVEEAAGVRWLSKGNRWLFIVGVTGICFFKAAAGYPPGNRVPDDCGCRCGARHSFLEDVLGDRCVSARSCAERLGEFGACCCGSTTALCDAPAGVRLFPALGPFGAAPPALYTALRPWAPLLRSEELALLPLAAPRVGPGAGAPPAPRLCDRWPAGAEAVGGVTPRLRGRGAGMADVPGLAAGPPSFTDGVDWYCCKLFLSCPPEETAGVWPWVPRVVCCGDPSEGPLNCNGGPLDAAYIRSVAAFARATRPG
jgi:hypothetical protein